MLLDPDETSRVIHETCSSATVNRSRQYPVLDLYQTDRHVIYRDATHPIEARKKEPGAHASGYACDIGVRGADALQIVGIALQLGFTGIGVNQKGSGRFIHLDILNSTPQRPRPTIWSY